MVKMDFSLGIAPLQTARALNGGRVKIVAAIEHGGIVIALMATARHRTFQLCRPASAAELGKQGRQQRTEQLDRDTVQHLTHLCVRGDLVYPKDRL
jgi:hypothetical protein